MKFRESKLKSLLSDWSCVILLPQDENRNTPGITHKPLGNTESQLRYENDRLKMALAQRWGMPVAVVQ